MVLEEAWSSYSSMEEVMCSELFSENESDCPLSPLHVSLTHLIKRKMKTGHDITVVLSLNVRRSLVGETGHLKIKGIVD